MKKLQRNALTGLALSVSAVALLASGQAFAQQANEEEPDGVVVADPDGDPDEEVTIENADGSTSDDGRIVVTGSRIRNDSFNSISPLQVLSTEAARDIGEFDAAQILQRSEAAIGQQIDATFQGFVLNNGPGSQTLNLRGLGADRTLLLVNGRRLAPAGVEGAPTNPSINLIPASLISRYDLLLDGASSVYGSDAVAGVGNLILRNDIDGFELFASGNKNEQSDGGDDWTVSAAWGATFDRGFIGIGAEYARRDEIQLGDRDFLAGCQTEREIDQDGNVFINDVLSDAQTREDSGGAIGEVIQPCLAQATVRRIIPQGGLIFGSIFADDRTFPGGLTGNTGILPGFSDPFGLGGAPQDRDGDGLLDVDFSQVTRNGTDLTPSFISGQDLYNVLAYGEYNLGTDLNITPFFEALYSRAEVQARSTAPQLFPFVPAQNAFNPCNIANNDCGALNNDFLGLNTLAGGQFARPTGQSFVVLPVVSIAGDRSFTETIQEQYRGVFGIRGDLPFIGDSWTFEVSGVYSRAEGQAFRSGVREDRLALALGIDPTLPGLTRAATPAVLSDGPCGSNFANPELLRDDTAPGCVPVNLFAPSLLNFSVGELATQAERDFIFDDRTFDTTYEQTTINAFITGDVFELPAGPVSVVLGAEYRDDTLTSLPDEVASEGLLFGFFTDEGGVGSRDLFEVFGEVNIPVFQSDDFGDLEFNASGRYTDDQFAGGAGTYSLRAGWRPIDAVLLKATFGTSFRSPNLRENFLAGQSGFNTLFDPCAVPPDAFDPLGGGFQPEDDTREPAVLANCLREGRDPTSVGIDSNMADSQTFSSVEITSGGSLELDPETSESFTAGIAITDNIGDVDYSFNLSYFDIQIQGAIAESGAQFIINECFTRDDGVRSNFCDFIEADTDPNSRRLISDVFAGFVNINQEAVRGIDFNARLGYAVPLGSETLDLSLSGNASHLIERSDIFLDDQGNEIFDDDAGEFGLPSWTGRATFAAAYSDFVVTWQTRWVGRTEQQQDGIDPFVDAFGRQPDGTILDLDNNGTPDFRSNTCTGFGSGANTGPNGEFVADGIVAGDGRFCRDVGFADDYFVHTISLRYNFSDSITLRAGITNVFDTSPPLVDGSEVFQISNVPIGNPFDFNGREFFGSINLRF